jgi:formate--tetrahydrofolate ligase
MNDRAIRNVVVGLGSATDGIPRQTGFDITAASEVMASLCLAESLSDLKARMARFIVGYDHDRQPVTAGDLKAEGSMAALLKDAIKPNLVQTIEGTPAFVHGGPFANIAHGTSSVLADKMGLKLGDYVVTEAGFGFDLGAEKFFHIMCRQSGLSPACVVLVATVRALKMHGGVAKDALDQPNPEAVVLGLPNLDKHMETIAKFGVPMVVCVNRFMGDTDAEVQAVITHCTNLGLDAEVSNVWADGGKGALELAETVMEKADAFDGHFESLYHLEQPIEKKIEVVAQQVYGARYVDFTSNAKKDLKRIKRLGFENLPVCIAKTQKSLSDNPQLLGRPKDFVVTVRQVDISAGAGFLVPITGDILRMPGLARRPSAVDIDVTEDGVVSGLF